jgi:ribonuclease E
VLRSRPAPVRPEPEIEEKPRQGFFGQLFSKLFSSPEPSVAAEKPTSRPQSDSKPAEQRTRAQNGSQQARKTESQGGESRGRNPKRGSKKTKSRSQTQTPSQAQAPATNSDGTPRRKKASRKRGGRKKAGQTGARQQNQPQSASAEQAQPPVSNDAPKSPPSQDKQDKQGENTGRKPRRRRSPYQTAGVKSRDGQAPESKDQNAPEHTRAENVSPDRALVEKSPQPLVEQVQSRPEPRPETPPASSARAEPKPESRPEPRPESKPDPKPETAAKSEPKSEPKVQAVEPKPQPVASESKPAVEKKPDSLTPANVIKDQHGVYTLKPSSTENPGKENSGAAE